MKAPATRRYDLDWLRVIAFLVLIFYHSARFYNDEGWHAKSVYTVTEIHGLMMLVNPWRLSLLFFISGVALRFVADKGHVGALMKNRLVRLGVPILFGMLVVVAPQSWLQMRESGEFTGSFWAFWPQYIDLASDFSISTPTWNHLWYVVYLLTYTLMILPFSGAIARFMEGRGRRWTARLFSGNMGMVMALVLPVLPHILIRITLDPYFRTTHDLTWDWANHAHSLSMLMTGFLLAKDEAFWGAIRRVMPFAIGLAIALAAVLSPLWANWELLSESGDWDWVIWPARIARIAYAWIVIVSLLGLAQRYLNHTGPVLRYMTEAVFPYYILHQTIIVVAGYWLTRQGLSLSVEASLVVLATVMGCAILHEVFIRRIRWLRPLFGLKPKASQGKAVDPSSVMPVR